MGKGVRSTLGPGGRNVAIDPWSPGELSDLSLDPKPIITKDGVTVAENIKLFHNQLKNIGSKLLIDAAQRSNEESGDGTTTTTVIANAVL